MKPKFFGSVTDVAEQYTTRARGSFMFSIVRVSAEELAQTYNRGDSLAFAARPQPLLSGYSILASRPLHHPSHLGRPSWPCDIRQAA